MSMGYREYVARSYAEDLARFGNAYTSGRLPLRLADGSQRENLFICDAADQAIVTAFREAGLRDARRFGVVVSLEGMLFAGVNCYDPGNFGAYVDALPLTIYVEAHGWGGVHRPHILLLGVADWGGQATALVEAGCVELLPAWASAYRAKFGRSGAHILRSLSTDDDMTRNPYGNALPAEVMTGLVQGLRRASAMAGEDERI